MTRAIFLLKPLHCQMNEKQGELVCCQKCNVWYLEICFGAKGNSFVVRHLSELFCTMIGNFTGRGRLSINCRDFYVLLTVHLSIILVINQLSEQNLVL